MKLLILFMLCTSCAPVYYEITPQEWQYIQDCRDECVSYRSTEITINPKTGRVCECHVFN